MRETTLSFMLAVEESTSLLGDTLGRDGSHQKLGQL